MDCIDERSLHAQSRECQPAYREDGAAQQGQDSLGGEKVHGTLSDFRIIWELRGFQAYDIQESGPLRAWNLLQHPLSDF